jgi:hypothetical protein
VIEDPRIDQIRAVLARWEQYRAMPIKTIPEWSMAESLFANVEEILDGAVARAKRERAGQHTKGTNP